MSHQVQQMNYYTKKLSQFEAWHMLTYKPVTTTITVIITFRKQKLCSTLKMVSFDLVFPCLFFFNLLSLSLFFNCIFNHLLGVSHVLRLSSKLIQLFT